MDVSKTILIAGPTASGKSRLAREIAARTGATIVNADSMQVYGELRVITARPPAEEEASAPHQLYGHVPAATRYSVGDWLRAVGAILSQAQTQGRAVILVGGTGLYFMALTDGLAEMPAIPREIGDGLRQEAREKGAQLLHDRLAGIDADGAATIRPSDTSRIIRALSVYEATGRTLGEWQRSAPAPALVDPGAATRIVLSPDPALLHERISARAEAMVGEGALAEVAAFLALGLDEDLPAMKAIGVRELGGHVRGDTSLDEAVAAVKTETRRYAKRQMTWFRGQMPDWQWVADPAALDLEALAS